jgi:hypothetical protein
MTVRFAGFDVIVDPTATTAIFEVTLPAPFVTVTL